MKQTVLGILIAVVISIFPFFAYSQPGIEWQKCLGGAQAESICQTTSGGYAVAGNFWYVDSLDTFRCNDGDTSAAFVAKLDGNGNTIWKYCYSGKYGNEVRSITQTKDGGFIFCGRTNPIIQEGIIFHGAIDAWVVKLDSNGNIQWQNAYGGSNYDIANSITQTYDGNYVFAGWTSSSDGDVKGSHGADDEWVVKLSTAGKIIWEKCLGGSNYERAGSIIQLEDSGLIICGSTSSNDGNVSGNHGFQDMWIVKLKVDTTIAWQTCAGGAGDDGGSTICKLADGRLAAVGSSDSYFLNDNYHGSTDFYCVTFNESGKMLNQMCYGGSNDDGATCIAPASDGGYLMAGQTTSIEGDVDRSPSIYSDAWILKCDASGNIVWQRSLGGKNDEVPFSILQSSDGGYVFAGETASASGDVRNNNHFEGAWNSWVVKLSDNADVPISGVTVNSLLRIAPNTVTEELNVYFSASSNAKSEISIYDMLGQSVYQGQDETSSLGTRHMKVDVSKLPEGMYLLKIRSGSQVVTDKFTVVK